MRIGNFSINLPQILLPVLLFIITFVVYVHNLSPSVFGGDVGDFASAIALAGVPHPSGYPLFTILGILVSLLPMREPLVWKIGLMNVVFSSCAVVCFFLIAHALTKHKLASVIASLSLGFFYTFWLYAEIGEVFALVNFFVLLLVLLLVKYRVKRSPTLLFAISFVYGLSLSHHEILIALFPAIAVLILWGNKEILAKWRRLLFLPLFFLLGLTPYLYIPLAARNHPLVNWDNAVTLHNFLSLVLRLDYGWKVNTGVDTGLRLLAVKTFIVRTVTEITPAGIVLAILGVIEAIKRKLYPFVFAFLISFILFGPVYVVYGYTPLFTPFIIGVLERFYMIASLFVFLFIPFGILFIAQGISFFLMRLSGQKAVRKIYIFAFTAVFFILPFSLFRFNFPKTDLHTVWIGDNLGIDFLTPLPQNSLLVLSGDTIFFNTEYVHVARNIRPDIQIVNIGTLQTTPQLALEIKKIQKKNKKIPSDKAYILALSQLLPVQHIFASAMIEDKKIQTSEFVWVPEGIVFAYKKKAEAQQSAGELLQTNQKAWSLLHVPSTTTLASLAAHNLTIAGIPQIYAQGYVNEGNYLISQFQDFPNAVTSFTKALAIDPTNQNGLIGLGYAQTLLGNCTKAEVALRNVIALYPDSRTAYIYLYGLAISCFKDSKKADATSEEFSHIFHTSLLKEIQQAYKDAKQTTK